MRSRRARPRSSVAYRNTSASAPPRAQFAASTFALRPKSLTVARTGRPESDAAQRQTDRGGGPRGSPRLGHALRRLTPSAGPNQSLQTAVTLAERPRTRRRPRRRAPSAPGWKSAPGCSSRRRRVRRRLIVASGSWTTASRPSVCSYRGQVHRGALARVGLADPVGELGHGGSAASSGHERRRGGQGWCRARPDSTERAGSTSCSMKARRPGTAAEQQRGRHAALPRPPSRPTEIAADTRPAATDAVARGLSLLDEMRRVGIEPS